MSQADELFQMIIENPANYLSYYIGYQEFYELLTDYKKMAGNTIQLKSVPHRDFRCRPM